MDLENQSKLNEMFKGFSKLSWHERLEALADAGESKTSLWAKNLLRTSLVTSSFL